ncbi:MAG: hypothetical protein CM15mP58_14280 [Burkholderiaceae bacterium]|nr:MAG: hypothetical protein CM15mP58_14280 [Burkholderiaceae bacterium]
MNRLDLLLNKFFDNFEFLGPVVLKSLLGIAFILYGSQNFHYQLMDCYLWDSLRHGNNCPFN